MIHPSILMLVSLGVWSDATVVVQTDKKVITDRPDASSVHLLLIKDAAGLLQVASSEYGVSGDFAEGSHAIAVDYHYPRNLLFWSTSKGQIFSCSLKESRSQAHVHEVRLVYEESRWYPESMAVDYLNDRLYVLDTKSNTIRVSNLEGAEGTLIGVGRRNYRPRQLEIDPERGYLFLLDEGEPASGRYAHVLRMKLDGSQPKVVDPPPLNLELVTAAMSVDRVRARLLLSSRSQRKIIAADYDGKLLDTVLEHQNGTLGMSSTASELFWINAAYYNRGAAFTDASLYKCDLDNATARCLPNSTRKLHDSFGTAYVRAVRAVWPLPVRAEQPAPPTTCQSVQCPARGDHFTCLAANCTCQTGYSADATDAERCRPVHQFVLYEDRRVVRTLCLQPQQSSDKCQAFAPFHADLTLRKNERTGFEYDSLARQLYFGGKNAIYRADVDTANTSVLLYQRAVFYGPMALDWLSKNLYYTEIEQRGNVSFYILKVLSARSGVDAQKSSTMLWELGKIHTMAACPWRGYLFLSVYHNGFKRFQMRRLHADGTNMTVLLGLNDTTFFSIDHPNEKLYSINANTSTILRSDFKGHAIENVTRLAENPHGITGFLVNEQFIYLQYRSRLLQIDKLTGKSFGQIDLKPYDTDMSMNLRLHSTKMFAINHQNLCAVDNGACDNFCFAIPDKDGQRLQKLCRCFDGVRCFGDTRSGLASAKMIKYQV